MLYDASTPLVVTVANRVAKGGITTLAALFFPLRGFGCRFGEVAAIASGICLDDRCQWTRDKLQKDIASVSIKSGPLLPGSSTGCLR